MADETITVNAPREERGAIGAPAAGLKPLRLAAAVLAAGVVLTLVVGLFHNDRADPNNHPEAFTQYAQDSLWTPVHLGQFAAFAVLAAGLLLLLYAVNPPERLHGWAARFAAISIVVTLALYGALQAVDGVALKRTVEAWASAPEAEKAARFASAQAVRWLEEGVRSYYDFMLGVTFLLLGIEIVSKEGIRRIVPRPIGYLMGLTGLTYLVQGWVLGETGFSVAHGTTQLPAYFFLLASVIWFVIHAFRRREV